MKMKLLVRKFPIIPGGRISVRASKIHGIKTPLGIYSVLALPVGVPYSVWCLALQARYGPFGEKGEGEKKL